MQVELLAITDDSEKLIERCARTCYKSSEGDNNEAFLQSLLKSGHHSVFEHASATFRVKGVSRALTHQLVRHRLASFSQESQRYVDETGMFESGYYVTPLCVEEMKDVLVSSISSLSFLPDDFCINLTVGDYYNDIISDISKSYKTLKEIFKHGKKNGLIKKGKVNEDARFVLPNACCSEIVVTANFREWRHIFELRCSKHAQWEIRDMAKQMLTTLFSKAPIIFEDLHSKYV